MADATGETKEPLRVAFDRRLKLEFHGARITSDGGLLAYRELDDALGLTAMAASALAEGRRGKNIRHRLLGLLRQAVYGRLAGYEDVNDAERLARDPGHARHRRPGGPRPAGGLDQRDGPLRDRVAGHRGQPRGAHRPVRRLDRPGARAPAAGRHHPRHGQLGEPDLRRAGGLGLERPLPLHLLPPAVRLQPVRRPRALRPAARQRAQRRRLARGARAGDRPLPRARPRPLLPRRRGFAKPELYELLEAEGIGYAIRLPANSVLQERIGHLLTRPVGRPPKKPQVFHASFSYQAQSWTKPRRVVAKVEWHQGELYPRVGFIVTNLTPAGRAGQQVLQRSRHGGAVDQGGQAGAALDAAVLPRLPGQRGAPPAVRARLQPRQLPAHTGAAGGVAQWSLTTLRERLVKIGAKVVRHGRSITFQMAEVTVPRQLFEKILTAMAALRPLPPARC